MGGRRAEPHKVGAMQQVVAAVVGCVVCGGGLLAQSPSVFRSGVDLVALSVVVTDPQDRFVGGLSAEDFAVFEDGVPQEVAFFAASNVPIDLAIVLDTSASMSDKMSTVHDAATGFASSARSGDRLTVVDVKDAVRVLHPLSEDVEAARAAIRGTTARGGTALYNGIYMTLKELEKLRRTNGEMRRQAMVVLSDGDDTASLVSFDDVMEVAKESGIATYTIALRTPQARPLAWGRGGGAEAQFALRTLAQETGGRAFFPADVRELAGVYGVIAEELASQYAIGYVSTNDRRDGAYRRLQVRVTEPGARTRTRAGYIATVAPRSPHGS